MTKREQHENSLKNLKKFTSEYQPLAENKSKGKQEANAKKREIEKSAQILERLLNKEIKNNSTGEVITQKEAMLLTLLSQAIKGHNLKAIEMILKIIGDFDETSKNIVINQPVNIDKEHLENTINKIMSLADEGNA